MIDLEKESDLIRFVSESVSIKEENDALLQCEAHPELWRNVALTFVEQRQLESALKEHVSGSRLMTTNSVEPGISTRRNVRISQVVTAVLIFALGACVSAIAMHDLNSASKKPVAETDISRSPVLVYVRPPETSVVEKAVPASPVLNDVSAMIQPMIKSEFRQQIRKFGLDVEERVDLYYVKSETGIPYAIPDRQIRFVEYEN